MWQWWQRRDWQWRERWIDQRRFQLEQRQWWQRRDWQRQWWRRDNLDGRRRLSSSRRRRHWLRL